MDEGKIRVQAVISEKCRDWHQQRPDLRLTRSQSHGDHRLQETGVKQSATSEPHHAERDVLSISGILICEDWWRTLTRLEVDSALSHVLISLAKQEPHAGSEWWLRRP